MRQILATPFPLQTQPFVFLKKLKINFNYSIKDPAKTLINKSDRTSLAWEKNATSFEDSSPFGCLNIQLYK